MGVHMGFRELKCTTFQRKEQRRSSARCSLHSGGSRNVDVRKLCHCSEVSLKRKKIKACLRLLCFHLLVGKNGVTFVTFNAHESALAAIEKVNGTTFKNTVLVVEKRRDFSRSKRSPSPLPYDEKTIVFSKAPRISKNDLRSIFFFLFFFFSDFNSTDFLSLNDL